jgi:hypothetical protein
MAYVYQVVNEDEFGNPIYGYVDDGVVDVDEQGDDVGSVSTGSYTDLTADRLEDYLSDAEIAKIYADPSRALDVIKTVPDAESWVQKTIDAFGKTAGDALKKTIFIGGDPAKGLNLAGLATGAMGLYSLFGNKSSSTAPTGGYNVPVPKQNAVRAQIPYPVDPNRRPGEAGRSYFTGSNWLGDTEYTAPENAAALQTAANTKAQGIASAYVPKTATVNPYTVGTKVFPTKYNPVVAAGTGTGTGTGTTTDASGVASLLPISEREAVYAAEGGLMSFAKGGANYLRGKTDGMADKLNTSIDNRQAAKLSHGEFVIPADVVSHLGNGNSDAGAEKLYQMMAKIRKARTGNPKQGKRINPDKFMPGGLASLNMGGAIGFAGATGSVVPTPGTSTSSALSNWAGPYVTNTLSEGAAFAARPYDAYTGPLTAGASDLQNQAFAGAQTVANAGYDPTKFTGGTFGADQAKQYMNPYLSAVLDPQMAELRKQADITRIGDAGRMAKAGAFGGSRQAIMESEGNRNLLNTQAATLGQGYASAYDKAMGQFNTQADRDMTAQRAGEESRQFGANFGLKSLGELERMGGTQRQIESEGIAADKAQFEEQRDYPAAMVKFKRDLMTGLPMSTQTSAALPMSGIGELSAGVGGLSNLYQLLAKFGKS